MTNEVEITVKSVDKSDFRSTQQGLDKVSASAKDAAKSTDDYADAQGKSSNAADDQLTRMAKLSLVTMGVSDAIGNASGILSDFTSIQTDARDQALAHSQALIDLEQAEQDADQAARDLRQSTIDLKQSQIDAKQATVDLGQSHIDQKQAALDVRVAQQELTKTIREYGKGSVEARQAAIDLKQAEQDEKQATVDSKQAVQDKSQALEDGKQAQEDHTQAVIDGKQALQDEKQALADASDATSTWSNKADMATMVVGDLVGAYGLANLALGNVREKTSGLVNKFQGAVTQAGNMKLAVKGLAGAGGLGLLATGLTQTNDKASILTSTLGGAALGFAVGGPWGAAIGAGTGAVLGLGKAILGAGEKSEDSAPKFDDLAISLDGVADASSRVNRKLIAQRLEQEGVLEAAIKMGVKTDDLVSALLGNEKAQARVNAELESYKKKTDAIPPTQEKLINQGSTWTKTLIDNRDRIKENNRNYDLLYDTMHSGERFYDDQVAGNQRVQDAVGATTRDITKLQEQYKQTPRDIATKLHADGIDKAIGGTERFRQRVNEILDNIADEDIQVKLNAQTTKTLSKIAEFAPSFHAKSGGRLRGPGTGTSDDIPLMGSDGEYMVKESIARHIYPFLDALNAGQTEALQAAGMKDGGRVSVSTAMNSSQAIGNFRGYAGSIHNYMHTLSGEVGKTVSDAINKMFAFSGGMPLGPDGSLSIGQAAQGLGFLKAQAGKPYGWAGVGPGSYDCSGIQNAGLNAALGRYPYSRTYGATGNAPWAGSRPGVGRVTLGWFTGDPGHMTGNWLGTNVESAGGVGVRVGSSARSPLDSMFNGLMHYADGGKIAASSASVMNLAEAVARQTADTHSPSKRWHNVSKDLVLGLAEGFLDADAINKMRSNIDRMVGNASDAVKNSLQKRQDVISSVVSGFGTSIFGGDTNQIGLMLQNSAKERNQARHLVGSVKKLTDMGLSDALIRQMLNAGESGQQQIFTLARQSPASIHRLNVLNAQTTSALRRAGMIAGNELYKSDINRNRERDRDAEAIARAFERMLDKRGKDKFQFEIKGGANDAERFVAHMIRKYVRAHGGDVQTVLGR